MSSHLILVTDIWGQHATLDPLLDSLRQRFDEVTVLDRPNTSPQSPTRRARRIYMRGNVGLSGLGLLHGRNNLVLRKLCWRYGQSLRRRRRPP